MKNKIKTFATTNDTEQWVVVVDGYIKGYDTEKEAKEVYASITRGEDIGDSPVGSCDLLPPFYLSKSHIIEDNKSVGVKENRENLVSQTIQINLEAYISKRWEVWSSPPRVETLTALTRWTRLKQDAAIWGEVDLKELAKKYKNFYL